jgi:hypothetical protein
MNTSQISEVGRSWWQSRTGIILLAFLAIAAFFLITEHTAHFFGLLPYALLLLCPLLHLFIHSGHGGHGNQGDHRQQTAEKPQPWQGEKS